ncbi:hypothetical protein CWIS_15100 [Cellulomonas sp. A375-1]|nr:hypothetical protein CWIS_15100 [Cellulomonas sp. A375-1]
MPPIARARRSANSRCAPASDAACCCATSTGARTLVARAGRRSSIDRTRARSRPDHEAAPCVAETSSVSSLTTAAIRAATASASRAPSDSGRDGPAALPAKPEGSGEERDSNTCSIL